MSEQEKKRPRIYDLLNAETKPKKKNEIDYAIWGVLENKIIATSHPNIGLLTTTIVLFEP